MKSLDVKSQLEETSCLKEVECIRERRFNNEKSLGRQEGMGSRVLCLKEITVTLSPNILLNLWQETDIIRGFTGPVCFGFSFQPDISCLGGDASVNVQELCIFADSFRIHEFLCEKIHLRHSHHPNRSASVHNALCPDLASKGKTWRRQNLFFFPFLFSSTELFSHMEILF